MASNLAKLAVVVICAAVALRWLGGSRPPPSEREVNRVGALQSLIEHSRKFDKEKIVKVTDGVYVAIGYALANMIMLEGTDGIILVDTTEHREPALKAFADFRKISQKPLKGIIITHFHLEGLVLKQQCLDHEVGAVTLLEQHPGTHIYMHETSQFELSRFVKLGEINFARASRQFGVFLQHGKETINNGIGLKLMQDHNMMYEAAEVSHTYKDRQNFTLAGINFELIHTPGETDDQTTVWLPDKKVVMPADNIYETFPNLYAIRGSPPRSCERWYRSLDKVRNLGAHHMVPSHTRPLSGKEEIYDVITHYRDAIQFVNDQTMRLMNMGLGVDEIVQRVKLPPKLRDHPWLQEHYGTVAWSVRSVYDYFLGWFDGDPINLNPLSKAERASKWSKLLTSVSSLSGNEKMLAEARRSLEAANNELQTSGTCKLDEMQWSLEVASLAHEATAGDKTSHDEAKSLYVRALRGLASCTTNANARNYYLTCVREAESGLKLKMSKSSRRDLVLSKLEFDDLMSFIPIRFKADECDSDFTVTVGMIFTDTEESYYYTIRHCIVEYFPNPVFPPPGVDSTLTTTSAVWRQMVARERNLLSLYASGEFTIDGSWLSFKAFMSLIEASL